MRWDVRWIFMRASKLDLSWSPQVFFFFIIILFGVIISLLCILLLNRGKVFHIQRMSQRCLGETMIFFRRDYQTWVSPKQYGLKLQFQCQHIIMSKSFLFFHASSPWPWRKMWWDFTKKKVICHARLHNTNRGIPTSSQTLSESLLQPVTALLVHLNVKRNKMWSSQVRWSIDF